MSGHLRFGFAAFLLLAGFSTPATSNSFTDLFSLNTAPADATPVAPAEEECLRQPGKSTADGRHWVYRYDGHRKCWFQAAEEATVKKPIHHAARHYVAASKENESPLRNRKAVVDAREELLIAAPTEASQPPLAPEMKVVDAAAVPVAGGAAPVPPGPVVAKPATDQLAPDQPTPRQVDVETLVTAAPPASDAVAASAPSATPVAIPIIEAGDDGREWTATWLGALLIALGLVSLLTASQALRGTPAGQATSRSEDRDGGHRGRRIPELSSAFGPNTFNRPAANEKLFRPQRARPAI